MGYKTGLAVLTLVGVLPLASIMANQQPFNLQIHLKTTNAQPVPPAEVANWCASIKKNLPTEAIPANSNPNQAVIHCSPESSGMLVNLNLQYTPPPPPPPPSVYVQVQNQVSCNQTIYYDDPSGNRQHTDQVSSGNWRHFYAKPGGYIHVDDVMSGGHSCTLNLPIPQDPNATITIKAHSAGASCWAPLHCDVSY